MVDRKKGWLGAVGLDRPELRAWAMYDWANSAMVTTIIAAVFPIYFSEVAGANLPKAVATQRFAIASTIGMVIIAILAPDPRGDRRRPADQEADARHLHGGRRRPRSPRCSSSTGATGCWRRPSSSSPTSAPTAASSSTTPSCRTSPATTRSTGSPPPGYALGYIGGGLLLALNLAWIMKPEWFGLPSGPNLTDAQATLPARLAFLSVAVWWMVFSIPLFRRVPEPAFRPDPEVPDPRPGEDRIPPPDGDLPRAEALQAGPAHARRVPDLQRRDRHDLPDGDDLRRGDRDRPGCDDRRPWCSSSSSASPSRSSSGRWPARSGRSGRSCSRWSSTRGSASSPTS